ncbi:MAG: iron-sulfur cluster assembly scaffold protein [Geobacteraceae bacterium]|nr:iron-sulfur cluster assembly scaffold protein [Geobacteraceae bacterium]
MYTEQVMDHFMNPRNIGVIEDASVIIQVGDPTCGDSLLLFLKLENDIVTDVKFKIKGCGAAIATSSMTTEIVKGMRLEEALAVTDEQVAEALGGLPEEKIHCSSLAVGAVHAGILRYLSPAEEDETM